MRSVLRFTSIPGAVAAVRSARRLALVAILALTVLAGVPSGRAAAAPAGDDCHSDLIIFTTSPGETSQRGKATIVRGSGVGGEYVNGRLKGYQIDGAQDITINGVTNKAQLHGAFTASGETGSIVLRYTGHADLGTGIASGTFVVTDGTGIFEGYRASGKISAWLISMTPPTFEATDFGLC